MVGRNPRHQRASGARCKSRVAAGAVVVRDQPAQDAAFLLMGFRCRPALRSNLLTDLRDLATCLLFHSATADEARSPNARGRRFPPECKAGSGYAGEDYLFPMTGGRLPLAKGNLGLLPPDDPIFTEGRRSYSPHWARAYLRSRPTSPDATGGPQNAEDGSKSPAPPASPKAEATLPPAIASPPQFAR
jgi:hypothetical protein